jgi:hypothetical protein
MAADESDEDDYSREHEDNRRRFVRARVFDCQNAPGFFPELHDTQGLSVPWLAGERRKFGVSFSGGGTRSSAATLGHLRGLEAIGLLDRLGYISAVSGGGWTATPWVFLPENRDQARFLGACKEPGELTVEDFEEAEKGSMAAAIDGAHLVSNLLEEWVRGAGDETAGRAVGNIFLEPFGLDDLGRFPGFHREAALATVAANRRRPDIPYYLEPEDFYTVRRGRPYLILSSTVTRIANERLEMRRLPCEMTPLYTGVRRLFERAGDGGLPIGGGYVETIGFDTREPIDRLPDGRYLVEIGASRYRFTLSDMLGSSGALLREVVDFTRINFLGLPEFRHWPILRPGDIEHRDYGFGDGALLENLGIMPLLARQVENIVVFINSEHAFDNTLENAGARLAASLEPLFRPVPNADLFGQATDELFDLNVVFESAEFEKLVDSFHRCQQAGEPLVHFSRLKVRENRHFLIRPYEAKIVWVYLDPVPVWNDALPAATREILERSELKRFPHYRTTFENFLQPIHLSKVQANALAHLSCFTVLRSAERIRRFFEI